MSKNTPEGGGSTQRPLRLRLQLIALYAGGFLGPFGGGVVASILPEIGDDLGVGPSAAASSLTAYLLPFAALMLVSGTLGDAVGQGSDGAHRLRRLRPRVVGMLPRPDTRDLPCRPGTAGLRERIHHAATACLVGGRNTPQARLGRALGAFGAFQAAGQSSAPLIGGLAAEFDWRLAFLVIAVVAGILGAVGLPKSEAPAATTPARLRDALRPEVLRIGIAALLGWGALGGLSFLLAFRFEDEFGLSPTVRGLLLTVFGVAGILSARRIGILIDRIGARSSVMIGALGGAVLVSVVGLGRLGAGDRDRMVCRRRREASSCWSASTRRSSDPRGRTVAAARVRRPSDALRRRPLLLPWP